MPKSVLVIDAIATHRIRLAALLESGRYATSVAPAMADFPGNLDDLDLIIVGLPDDRLGNAIASLGSQVQNLSVPVLCLDGNGSPLRRLLVLRAGAREVLPSKSPDDLLLARVRGLIREGEAERESRRRRVTAASFGFSEAATGFAERANVVCVGDLGDMPERLSALVPYRVMQTSVEDCFAEESSPTVPDAIVTSTGAGRRRLARLLPELRDRTHLRPAPVLALYPPDKPDLATHALALGAAEIAVDTASVEELEWRIGNMLKRKRRNEALRRSDEQSYELAMTDQLTGLFNRRYAERYLSGLTASAHEASSEFCLVLVDIDHFKSVNDTHGHAIGDQVLREVGRRLVANLRACDLVARYGGEEFLIVLPETSPALAAILAERLRDSIGASSVKVRDALSIDVTVSIGVATGALQADQMEQRTGTFDVAGPLSSGPILAVFEAADAALYRAKNMGRDRVEVSAA